MRSIVHAMLTGSYIAMNAATDTGAGVAIDSRPEEVHTVAEIINQQAGVLAEVDEMIKAKEVTQRGPAVIMFTLMQELTPEQMSLFPVPGSKRGETGNLPFDKYETLVPGAKGALKTQEGSFYTDLFNDTPRGKEIAAELEAVRLANAGDPHARKDLVDMGKQGRGAYQNMLEGRRTTGRNAWKRAFELKFAIEAVNSELANLVAGWKTVDDKDGNETLDKTNKPIMIYDKNKRAELDFFSVGQVLGFDIPKAKEKGGTLASLIQSSRQGGQGQGGVNKAVKVPTDMASAEPIAAMFAHFLNDPDSYAKIAKRVAQKDNEDIIETIGDIVMGLDGIWQDIAERYKAIKNKRNRTAEAKAAVTGKAA